MKIVSRWSVQHTRSSYQTKLPGRLSMLGAQSALARYVDASQPMVSKESTHMRVVLPGGCQVASITSRLG